MDVLPLDGAVDVLEGVDVVTLLLIGLALEALVDFVHFLVFSLFSGLAHVCNDVPDVAAEEVSD